MSQTRKSLSLWHRKNHIPHDIVLSILGQLPVKSVMRLRFVSKSLYSSIASTDFISTHLNNNISSNINRDNACVIHMLTSSPYSSNRPVCTVALDRTFDTISEFGIPFDFPTVQVQIVGSCNGLLCLADYYPGNVIYLWNPIIRKFKKLPNTCLGNTEFNFFQLGFAYHSENNDYKVVRIPISPSSTLEIEVYTLSSDSWRRVGISLGGNGIYYHFKRSLLPTPLVSGALHWIANITKGEEINVDRMLMSFCVNSEKFRELALPHGSINDYTHETHLSSFKGKLAFITREEPGFRFSMWVMREYGVIDSWTKLFVVPYDNERISCCTTFTEYGSFLMLSFNHISRNKFVLIDIETLQEKKKDLGIQISLCVATFMESLVLLDGANIVSY